MPPVDITLFVPALNEERKLPGTLDSLLGVAATLPELAIEILVVDDGSGDRTASIAETASRSDPRIRLLRHPENRGLGAAFKTALAAAHGSKLMIVPGDNDLPAATLAALLRQAKRADLVMCYFPDRAQRGRSRQILSSLFGLAYATAFDVHVQYINGPSLYPVDRLRELELFSNRFSIVAEINVKLLRRGVTFIEIAGRRQTGLEGSTSLSWRNLRETLAVFVRLCYEVLWRDRRLYGRRPSRVPDA
jgi:glycosyltransferase involved in cell wall biosynthesis